ncbi:Formamidopyrimidine-DNA glycosylase [Lasiodiplodia theobromae]|uniref:Formamidopyrimidine-DNA glycosylase n=1 Tax=Lasiodiplodia theobromae TaxID=45133 RepID=UPI0015C3EB38|nr:Formamidopyrimidine-DNA glycosylase [Lasiodiplodia theobromae]KAF4540412.1 Formamidopyrimidine-DNA glycosylase [Lasiodiplodia theobromae]
MPEIGEVARIVHYLRKHVAGKTIRDVRTQQDDIVYGKVGTSASAFEKAMTGKKVLDARQQGKYFWLVMSEPPHPLMHFGMSGWMKFSNDDSAYYKPTAKEENPEWPPKYWKFVFEMDGDGKCEAAFVDARRLGRIRLIDAPGEELRKVSPLKENGPDPVIDKDILTVDWLAQKMRSKRIPVKALLLDQANISGVGNWVGDEVLYQAKIHPEQYSNTFSDTQIKQLHDALIYVCGLACETLADSDKFPEDWLMKHRWGKGKKDANKLPNGASITFLKVGGRTSAVVPSVQKKTGAVAGDAGISEQEDDEETERKPNAKQRRNPNTASNKAAVNGSKRGRGKKEEQAEDVKQEEEEGKEDEPAPKRTKKGGAKKGANGAAANVAGQKAAASEPEGGRRRSSRNK